MPSRNTDHLTWASLTLDLRVSLHGCSSKVQPLLLILDQGYLLMAAPPDLEHGVAPLSPPVPTQPPLLDLGLLLLAAAPDLECVVAPLVPSPLTSGVG